jgi:hypothetical protein
MVRAPQGVSGMTDITVLTGCGWLLSEAPRSGHRATMAASSPGGQAPRPRRWEHSAGAWRITSSAPTVATMTETKTSLPARDGLRWLRDCLKPAVTA